jgi:TolB-like protein/tetratricopeptide (TPR) repeat protein
MQPPDVPATFRFGDFELDVAGYSLRRAGQQVRLERRPMDLLILLVQRRRELVSRNDIVERLWGTDVFVDADMGVNTAIRKIRQVLGDAPETPSFVETVSGKGYRFIAEVEAVQPSPTPSASRAVTLAVLPFENLGGTPEHDYIADGFTEEATTALGQIDPEHLSVIGRTSVMGFKRTTKSLADIGRELGATYVIEGSVRAERKRWRVTSKLIRARDQVQIWSASFDSEPSSMLEFQRELSTAIAEPIRLRLSPERLTALGRRQSRSAEAYDLYLRGRHFWNQLTPPTNRRAVEHFARAAELDPEYSLAWSGLADAFSASPINADARPLDVWPRARDAAARAVGSGPDIAESQTSQGMVHYWLGWDWRASEAAYRKALALDPSNAHAYRMLGVLLGTAGRHAEARAAMRRARELDPLQPMNHALSAHVALLARDYSGGLEFARHATVVGPAFWIGYFQLAWAHERLGHTELALEALHDAETFASGNSKMIALRGYILAMSGRRNEATEVLRTLDAIAHDRYVPPYAFALIYAGLEDRERALESLELAYQARDVHLIWLPMDARWDMFRRESAFVGLIERCGFTTGQRRHSWQSRRRNGPRH